jgi:hypothetical protein
MENRVGNNTPAPEVLEEKFVFLQALLALFTGFGVTLTSKEIKKLPRAKRGAELFLNLISRLAKEYGLNLPAAAVEAIEGDRRLAVEMQRFQQVCRNLARLAGHTRLQAESEAWQGALAFYAVLKAMSTRDPALAEKLRPAVSFLSRPTPADEAEEAAAGRAG